MAKWDDQAKIRDKQRKDRKKKSKSAKWAQKKQ